MKITMNRLRSIIRESLSQDSSDEEIVDVVLPLIKAKDWQQAAQALLSIFSYADLQLFLDDSDLRYTLEDAGATWDDFRKIESAAWPIEDSRIKAAIGNDPDKQWLEFLGRSWSSYIEPDDLKSIKWKEYKRYIRLSPPDSISHGEGEIHVTKRDVENSSSVGSWDDFKQFLSKRASGQLKRRPARRRSPGPIYD